MTLRYLLTAAALALASPAHAADPPVVRVDGPPADPPPVVELPPFKPSNVAAFDAAKVKEVPWDLKLVKVPEAHAKNPAAKGRGVRVAILDTGVQHDHPGLNGQVKGEYNAITKRGGVGSTADGHGHGTWCVGAVHAVVPEADLYSVKVLSDRGSGVVTDIAHGVDYAVTEFKADVISMSLGGRDPDQWQQAAVRRAVAAGVVVVCAAGNDGGGPGRDTEGYPARFAECVSVAACDRDRNLASFSSWGPNVFTVDPGVNVTGLLPNGQQGEMDGTSMACPKQAGKCASWIASNRVPKEKDRVDHYRAAVKKASPFTERNNARGHGLFTLDRITGEATTPPPPPPPPGEKVYVLDLAKLKADGYTSVRIDLSGTAGSSQPIPVQSVPSPAPQLQPAPQFAPVPTWSGFNPAPAWTPPPPVYQPMPPAPFPPAPQLVIQGPLGGSVQFTGPCRGGVCPAPAFGGGR